MRYDDGESRRMIHYALLVGTYVVGDARRLSEELPLLFPPPTPLREEEEERVDDGGKDRRGGHVPTLVLHGRTLKDKYVPSRQTTRNGASDAEAGNKTAGGMNTPHTVTRVDDVSANQPARLRGGVVKYWRL